MTIQSQATTQNVYGEPTGTWSEFAKAWAKIDPLSGDERVEMRQGQGIVTHQITLDYLSTLTRHMRISFRSRTFHIHDIRDVDEKRRTMVLSCSEVVS